MRLKKCKSCGVEFESSVEEQYKCPDCIDKFRRENVRRVQHTCKKCGADYIVTGGKQKYCKDCADQAIKEKIRSRKREYNRENYAKRATERIENKAGAKICVICGERIYKNTPEVTCSPACAAELIYQNEVSFDRASGRDLKAAGPTGQTLKLRIYRTAKDMSIRELSKKSGVDVNMISRYERGIKQLNEVKFLDALALASALDISPYDLLP